MRVLIKGMEMPKSCAECFAFKSNASGQLFCRAKRIAFGKEDAQWLPKCTPNWCPLIPVPDHGRLIDAFDTVKKLTDEGYYNAAEIVSDMHTIIPASTADKEGEG